MRIFKIHEGEKDLYNESHRWKIKGKYALELPDGEKLYGAHLKKDLVKALKTQEVDAFSKFKRLKRKE